MKNIGRLGGYKRNIIIIQMDNKNAHKVTDYCRRHDNISMEIMKQIFSIEVSKMIKI